VDLSKVLAQLRLELENLDLAIASLERLAAQKRGGERSTEPAEPKRRARASKSSPTPAPAGAPEVQKRTNTK